MFRPGSSGGEPLKGTKVSQAAERDEVQRRLGAVLILREAGTIKAPVVTLAQEKANIYNVVEKHLRPESVVGADRFWRVIRASHQPNLEAWRPRVHGTQLKALQGVRLPLSEAEWEAVRETLVSLAAWLRDGSNPEIFLAELRELAAYCEEWWENRTKREASTGPGKRPALNSNGLPAKRPHLSPLGQLEGVQGHAVSEVVGGAAQAREHPQLLQNLASVAVSGPASYHMPASQAHQMLHREGTDAGPSNAGQGEDLSASAGYMEMMASTQQAQAHEQAQAQAQAQAVAAPDGYGNSHPGMPTANGPAGDPSTSQQAAQLYQMRVPSLTLAGGEPRHAHVVVLNVGGRQVQTELATLMAVPESHLCKLAMAYQQYPQHQLFIDRNPEVFLLVLDYLRAERHNEMRPSLPEEPDRLDALHREALHFNLPGLAERTGAAVLAVARENQEKRERLGPLQYDSIYVETGLVKDPENNLQYSVNDLNQQLLEAQNHGFEIDSRSTGVHHHTNEEGEVLRNVYHHFLLKKLAKASEYDGSGGES